VETQAHERTWVWRPDPARVPASVPDRLVGTPVYGFGPADADGYVQVVLHDGTRVRAAPGDIVAE
jgi:hypothetical protein